MDKKAKKRLDLVHQQLNLLRQQLAGAKKQPDDPDDIQRLQKEIAKLEAEAVKLKSA